MCTYLVRPFTARPPAAQKPPGHAIEGQPWGTPTGEEIAGLLGEIEYDLDRALVRRCEVVNLLGKCHTMLLRCQAALPSAPALSLVGKEA
jgi:hypothetical protein